MVNSKSENNSIRVGVVGNNTQTNVSSSNNNINNEIQTSNNKSKIYEQKALEHANSAKMYAEQSEESAEKSAESAKQSQEALSKILNNQDFKKVIANEEGINRVAEGMQNVNYVGENIAEITQLVTSLENLGDTTNINIVASNIDNINSLAEDIQTVEENKNIVLSQVAVAVEQANKSTENATISTEKAEISTNQANISTQKALESKTFSENALIYSTNAKTSENNARDYSETALQQSTIATTQANISITQANNSLNYSKNAKTSEENALIYSNNAKLNTDIALENANISEINSLNAEIWAEGTDEEVQALGGVHSAKTWAEIGGSSPDIDTTNLVTKDGTETISGAKTFSGSVHFVGSGDTNALYIALNTRMNVEKTNNTVLGFSSDNYLLGHGNYNTLIRGKGERPYFLSSGVNLSSAKTLALSSDIPDTSNFATKDEVEAKQDKGNYLENQSSFSVVTNAISIGNNVTKDRTVNIGTEITSTGLGSVAIGNKSSATGNTSVSIGYNAKSTANNNIQLGNGTNSTANSLQVASYQLFDTSTGYIPDERLSDNIARKSDIKGGSGGITYEDLNEEVELNPTPIVQEWQEYQEQVNNVINAYTQQITTLQTELNKVMSVRYVVEKWNDGANYYVIYSDGWCKQGGNIKNGATLSAGKTWACTIELFKEMANLDYEICVNYGYGEASAGAAGQEYVYALKTTSSFVSSLYNRNGSTAMPNTIELNWTVEGYIL